MVPDASFAVQAVAIQNTVNTSLENNCIGGVQVAHMLRQFHHDSSLHFPVVVTPMVTEEEASYEVEGNPRQVYQSTSTTHVQMDLQFTNRGSGLVFGLDVDHNTFGPVFGKEIFNQFQQTLHHLGYTPTTAGPAVVAELPARHQQTLAQWNSTALPFASNAAVTNLFELSALRVPCVPCLSYSDQIMSYAEVFNQTAGLAAFLAQLVSGPGVVGLYCLRSVEEVVGMIGIMRASLAYVPLDPTLPAVRLGYLIDQCACLAVAAQSKIRSGARGFTECPLIVIEEVASSGCQTPTVELTQCIPSMLAYVIFTSGTTGKPKGVAVQHG